jgi:hypothetical protein
MSMTEKEDVFHNANASRNRRIFGERSERKMRPS